MTIFSKLEGLRATVKSGLLSRLLAALLGGTLNQKVILLIGLGAVLAALYAFLMEVWIYLLIGLLGSLFVHLAVKDYERTSGTGM